VQKYLGAIGIISAVDGCNGAIHVLLSGLDVPSTRYERCCVGKRDATQHRRLATDERQQVGIDLIGVGGRHAVGEAWIGLKSAVLQQFR